MNRSQAPNKVAEEWLLKGGFFPEDISVYREKRNIGKFQV